jgi:AAA+ ATPase superfamily predicted ATPase
MENPFKYGVVVTGKDFVDREKELEELPREIRSGKSVVIYSNRRMGKSSLLAELARRNSKEFTFVYVDLYGITNKSRFLAAIVEETARAAYGRAERFASGMMEMFKEARVRFVVTEKGLAGVEFDRQEVGPGEVSEVLDFPEKVAKRKGKTIVMVFDEFQEIAALDGVSLLKSMRAKFQFHKNVVYIFSGSKRHLLHQIFEEVEGAFFKFARPMELGPIPRAEFEKFITDRFRAAGGKLDSEYSKRILDVSKGYAYYAQQVAHELFDISDSPTDRQDVESAIEAAVDHQAPAYSYLWDSTRSHLQRKYLIAVASEPGVSHGTEFIWRHGLKSYSHVQKTERLLEARGIIEHGEIVDPLFALWLRQLKSPV